MEKPIKYKRFSETHNENSIQEFFDRLVTEGWEIIYYNEIRQSSGSLSSSPQEVNIHITVVGSKRQSNVL
jgi:hypothetical protein